MAKIEKIIYFPQHLKEVCSWHQNEWGYLNPDRTLTDRIEEMKSHLKQQSVPATYLALEDNLPVGCASILKSDMDTRLEFTPWLASVFVKKEYRHKKIGRNLVKTIMEHANSAGIEKLFLYTPDREHFYKKMGWKTIEKVFYHNAEVTIMEFEF
jgi:N-acetylglutamate synthase-like GNAT family acetyltransferase